MNIKKIKDHSHNIPSPISQIQKRKKLLRKKPQKKYLLKIE